MFCINSHQLYITSTCFVKLSIKQRRNYNKIKCLDSALYLFAFSIDQYTVQAANMSKKLIKKFDHPETAFLLLFYGIISIRIEWN